MRTNKKGDISMSTIVLAVIAILILIIVAAMIIKNFASANKQLDSCENKGGKCSLTPCAERTDGFGKSQTTWSCDKDSKPNQYCCLPG